MTDSRNVVFMSEIVRIIKYFVNIISAKDQFNLKPFSKIIVANK